MDEKQGQTGQAAVQQSAPTVKKEVLVLGDYTLDLFVYDRSPPAHKDRSPDWISPQSPAAWQFADGYAAALCVGAGAAVHAMLEANGIGVTGNAERLAESRFCAQPSSPKGAVFILHRRSNPIKKKDKRVRNYWSVFHQKKEDSEDLELVGAIHDRSYTWRVAQRHLSPRDAEKAETRYVDPTIIAGRPYDGERLVCLFDIQRGANVAAKEGKSRALDCWASRHLANGTDALTVVRTADPTCMAQTLSSWKASNGGALVLVCPLRELGQEDMRVSGTWTTVWHAIYDYLRGLKSGDKPLCLDETGKDWRCHIVVPVYEDGVVWFGPDQECPHDAEVGRCFTENGLPPIGRLFILPGCQPGLLEFKEPGSAPGFNTLFTYTLVEKLHVGMRAGPASPPGYVVRKTLPSALPVAATRVGRLHHRGYCRPKELMREPGGTCHYIHYPLELWHEGYCRDTDRLTEPGGLRGGAFEITGKFADEWLAKPRDQSTKWPADAFDALIKRIAIDSGDQVSVAAPAQCDFVATWFGPTPAVQHGPTDDSFIREQIDDFELWRRGSIQFGKLTIANPEDTEPILDLAEKMRQHVMRDRFMPPDKGKVFSFALFGTPGSGKSTLAAEIQKAVDPTGEIFTSMTFNISQFAGKEQLTHALGQVAAQGLGGKVPLVLWDEFDTVLNGKRGGWLSHFLMPMQDARFFDGVEDRPLGTAVFAFIGGTFADARAFRDWACGVDRHSPGGGKDEVPEAFLLKGRDFHSRLFAALNMPSIIYRHDALSEKVGRDVQEIRERGREEDYEKLARAVLLRHWFIDLSQRNGKTTITDVDEDVLAVLMNIPLRHGARSLQRIVEACMVTRPSVLRWHHLPPPGFLAEHIETTLAARGSESELPRQPWEVETLLDTIKDLWV